MKKTIILVFCSLFLFTGCKNTSYFQSKELIEETNESKDDGDNTNLSEVMNTVIYVQVAGAVAKPGVYDLPVGSRVFAAIEAAGGLLEDADDTELNQASVLEDGQKLYVYTSKEIAEMEKAEEASEESNDGLVNINTASASELTSLPGIGQAKANQIITYRETNGNFAAIEDIKKVSGIGEGIYNQINTLIKI